MPEMCMGTNIHILCHTLIEFVSILWVVKKSALLSHCDKHKANNIRFETLIFINSCHYIHI